VNTLQRKISDISPPGASWLTLHSFGFGTSLDSKLLEAISVVGNGIYGYLPDCSMVGSVAINATAASLATVAPHVYINGKLLGNLLVDASKFIHLPGIPVGVDVEISCEGVLHLVKVAAATAVETQRAALLDRLNLEIAKASSSSDFSVIDGEALLSLTDIFRSSPDFPAIPDCVQAALQDLHHVDPHKGQLTKAIKTADWFTAWGLNHLISYSRAIACQQTTNFKDALLQFFVSPSFARLQDLGNDIFDNLPAPIPSLLPKKEFDASFHVAASSVGAPIMMRTAAAAPMQNFNMADLNDARGGCWSGWARVLMADGSEKWTHAVKAGDVVAGGHRVQCVVKTETKKPMKMVRLGNFLSITPWHPVHREGRWRFPEELSNVADNGASSIVEFNATLYDFVLESGHFVRIGPYKVCTLGHHFQDDEVIGHAYFGTNAVIEHLRVLPGWDSGCVTVSLGYLQPQLDFVLV
jgi:hypothetical protein